jgi:hypothetical protein
MTHRITLSCTCEIDTDEPKRKPTCTKHPGEQRVYYVEPIAA